MIYCPPFIFAHRCFLERGESELSFDRIREKFGEGGNFPDTHHRWIRAQNALSRMTNLPEGATGVYYGFRTREDQMAFYLTFQGQLRGQGA